MPSSSYHRRRTHQGLWLTGPDGQSHARLGRHDQEYDDDGVSRSTSISDFIVTRAPSAVAELLVNVLRQR